MWANRLAARIVRASMHALAREPGPFRPGPARFAPGSGPSGPRCELADLGLSHPDLGRGDSYPGADRPDLGASAQTWVQVSQTQVRIVQTPVRARRPGFGSLRPRG